MVSSSVSDSTSLILFAYILTTVILFWVRVPVLSEHTTLHEPRVSTAGSFLTMAFFLLILLTPIASTIVTTVASPSGIAATASAIAVLKHSNHSVDKSAPFFFAAINSSPKTTTHIPKASKPIILPT